MVTPTTATAGAETSMDMVRLREGPETSTDRLEVEGSQGINMAMVSLRMKVEVPTTAIRTRLEEEEDTARALKEGDPGPMRMEVEDTGMALREEGPGPGRMEVEDGPRPTPGVEEEPPEPAGPPPHSPPS